MPVSSATAHVYAGFSAPPPSAHEGLTIFLRALCWRLVATLARAALAGSKDESGSADHDSSTLDGTSSTSTSESGTTTEESGSTSEEESSSDTLSDTFEDGPIMMCAVTETIDCKSCIQNNCCFEDGDMECINGVDMECGCVLDCLIETQDMANCGAACAAGQLPASHADQIYTCAVSQCDDWCL